MQSADTVNTQTHHKTVGVFEKPKVLKCWLLKASASYVDYWAHEIIKDK